jgi:hypothetical protein
MGELTVKLFKEVSEFKGDVLMGVYLAWNEEDDNGYEVYVRDIGQSEFGDYEEYCKTKYPDAFELVATEILEKEIAQELGKSYAKRNNISYYGLT